MATFAEAGREFETRKLVKEEKEKQLELCRGLCEKVLKFSIHVALHPWEIKASGLRRSWSYTYLKSRYTLSQVSAWRLAKIESAHAEAELETQRYAEEEHQKQLEEDQKRLQREKEKLKFKLIMRTLSDVIR